MISAAVGTGPSWPGRPCRDPVEQWTAMSRRGRKPRRKVVGRRRSRARPWALAAVVVAAIALATFGAVHAINGSTGSSSAQATPTPAAQLLATTASQASGQTVDGIPCDANEQLTYHVHSHLAVYVDGALRGIPLGIGIPDAQIVDTTSGPFAVGTTCLYWLHTHTADGIIHIEAPAQRSFTLGNFFDIWRQPLSATQVGPAQGKVVAYVNGQPFSGNPASIELGAHTLIQLDVGRAVPPQPFTFPSGL
jgi:hypothetical protein